MATKKPNRKKKKKRLASIQDPTIEAIADGLFRFAAESQAVSLLQRLSGQFAIARDQEPLKAGQCPTLILWIRDFGLTKEESAKGYQGHFAHIHVKPIAEDKYTLIAEKIKRPLPQHPHSQRPSRRHPNHGHPVIRAAQRNKLYPEIEQARMALLKMHEEFPETSIPGRDKLHALLFSRQYKPPIHKVTIRIVAAPGQGYRFELSDNIRKSASGDSRQVIQDDAKAAAEETPKKIDGKFTSLVALQRKKRVVKPKSKSDKK